MSQRGSAVHRTRSPDTTDDRDCTRLRTEGWSEDVSLYKTHPFTLASQGTTNGDGLTEGELYIQLCKTPGGSERLPPGWEKVLYEGAVVYLDHISREAHEVPPWEVWRKRSGAAASSA
ncbi:uncharacterized protein TEOVI_000720300 [Trypanosoma equiperdum]|uniref:WW domain-containing protein n=4 Tax=Trypanozoon TaxID=39700 RepID=Q389D2_TRYB2|nr:hypothetical protein, conserved [Trypanosoma brucei gambiense DAL972]XP_823416.1 hypothetical protein, conserved [Trypanosoma brucei brucei TREU927]RHW69396.1 hypothetical protein DPX39_100127400 [Trypanosoma brucei equiperdum]SCU65018.1 hypothetical protein, conserved [Trypanosoma equiperdum]EAN78588.1 hypothetical protein, conserved [Trypanosoma brucei brucei TREU927]CBH16363.1 hypothetical protein, conserved [Trypanosoma brucei gambiense DAL972]|eukprot:XP_011778627.1 hypothetical protein, conserved [Trypanosoma brucei gambiense DAL972]